MDRPSLTPERIEQLLCEAMKGSAELDEQLRQVFRPPDTFAQLRGAGR